MGLPIDEAWEYFVADPEVDEIVHGNKHQYTIDEVSDWRLHKYNLNGIRLGKGNPDFYKTHLAPDPDKLKSKVESRNPKLCKTCKELFYPKKKSNYHCSTKCYKRKGRPRELPLLVNCIACPKQFRPREANQTCCSKQCAAKLGGTKKAKNRGIDNNKFKELWESGSTIQQIMKELAIAEATVKRIRRKLNLKPRPLGNHSGKAWNKKDNSNKKVG